MLEAGLVDHYKYKTWIKMKREYDESDEVKLKHEEKPFVTAMSMDELQGIFYLCGVFLCGSVIVFFFEWFINGTKKKK